MDNRIGAIVLAAGMSKRMGEPKMLLPWGNTTVIGQVLRVLDQAGLQIVIVVTGGERDGVEAEVIDNESIIVFNPNYKNGEMILSVQCGLKAVPKNIHAVMIVLGDQPLIEVDVVQELCHTYSDTGADLIFPSYRMKRGHPWIIKRTLWDEIIELQPPDTLRDFIRSNSNQAVYITVETESVLLDLDYMEDYERLKPK